MADVFISYSRSDKTKAARIASGLRALGMSVWMDDQLRSGDVSFDKAISDELIAAAAVLACWSPASIASEWPRSEASFAHKNKKLFACFLAPCELIPPFNLVQTEDLSDWEGESDHPRWIALVGAIAAKLKRPQLEDLLRARAAADPAALLMFAQSWPEEPEARKIWQQHAARFQDTFNESKQHAEAEAEHSSETLRVHLADEIASIEIQFDTWLEDKRQGRTHSPPPSALTAVRTARDGTNEKLAAAQTRIAALTADAARARGGQISAQEKLGAAESQIETLHARLRQAGTAGSESQDSWMFGWKIPSFVAIVLALLCFMAGWALSPSTRAVTDNRKTDIADLQNDLAKAQRRLVTLTSAPTLSATNSKLAALIASSLRENSDRIKNSYWPATAPSGLYEDETKDWKMPATKNLQIFAASNTPLVSPVALRITTAQLVASEKDSLLIDVWETDKPHNTVPGAFALPGGGASGTINDNIQQKFVLFLDLLTGGNKDRRIVIFCASAQCWESYNALLRAYAAGYMNLLWYRGGVSAWEAAHLVERPAVGIYAID